VATDPLLSLLTISRLSRSPRAPNDEPARSSERDAKGSGRLRGFLLLPETPVHKTAPHAYQPQRTQHDAAVRIPGRIGACDREDDCTGRHHRDSCPYLDSSATHGRRLARGHRRLSRRNLASQKREQERQDKRSHVVAVCCAPAPRAHRIVCRPAASTVLARERRSEASRLGSKKHGADERKSSIRKADALVSRE
jgi:hypothetical protein